MSITEVSTKEEETYETVLKSLQRHINCLSDDNKAIRRRGLSGIEKETIKNQLGGTVLQSLSLHVLKPLLKCLADSSESNREFATELLALYIDALPSPEEVLHMIIPMLVQRLGQERITEPSEEQRLLILEKVLLPCLDLCGKKIHPYMSDVLEILKHTIVDPFAEVKKVSCKIASKLASAIPEYFHMQSETLIVPLMSSINHQHSKVRIAVIEATGNVVQYGNGKTVEDVISHLAQRFFDPSAQVRMVVTKVIGRWLVELPDRYSFFHKFIPLLLTSFDDDYSEICEEAKKLWVSCGELYEKEQEDDLKDKMDFGIPKPELYPANVERPELGCRELVQRNLSKLMGGIVRDLGDWVVETRVKTSQLLYHLLLHAEVYTTQHMQPLTQALLKASVDEDPRVVKGATKSARLIGSFVEPETFCKILLQTVRSNVASPAALMILSSAIDGCSDNVLGCYLNKIVEVLVDPEVCQASEIPHYLQSILGCCKALMTTCRSRIREISYDLFYLIITCMSLTSNDQIHQICEENLQNLSDALECNGTRDLFQLHTKQMLDSMQGSYTSWTNDSIEQRVFNTLLDRAGSVVGEVLEEVIPILRVNLQTHKDVHLRLSLFTLLSNLIMKAGDDGEWKRKFSSNHVESIVSDMISPNMVWRAGRVAGALRSIAVATLWALLRSNMLPSNQQSTCHVFAKVLTPLKSMLTDDNKTTRLTTVKVFRRFFNVCGTSLHVDDVLHKLYNDLLTRLDDSDDQIRSVMASCWNEYFKCFNKDYDQDLYKAHLEEMYSSLLLHMDDPSAEFQTSVKDALIEGGRLYPQLLIEEIQKVKHKHRTPYYCEQLSKHFSNLTTSGA